MKPFRHRLHRVTVSILLFAGLLVASASAGELLPPGFRPLPLGVHALVGGRVVIKPGETLEAGTIIIRDGLIQAVGRDVPVPDDARVWDLKGLTIYAGFIEPYLVLDATNPPIWTLDLPPAGSGSLTAGGVKFYGAPGSQTDMGNAGPGYEISRVTPEFRAVEKYSPKEKALAPLRELGFTTALVAPTKGIIRGTSAFVALSDENPNRTVIRPDVFQHIAFETHDDDERAYPGSLMGVIAVIRQTFFDAQHYALDHADYQARPLARQRPGFDPALEALAPIAGRKQRVMFEPGSTLMVSRAAQLSRELRLDSCIVSCGQEWRRPDLVKATGSAFIVPVNFPSAPKMPSEDDWDQVTLDQLRSWDWAPENPALLRQQGLDVALTTYGLDDKKNFRKNLRLALDRGLSEIDALAGLTTVPAKLCGVDAQVGTIEAGKLADLVVVEGKSYFDDDTRVRAVWIDGRIYPAPGEVSRSKGDETKSAEAEVPPKSGTPAKEEPEKHPQPPSLAPRETSGTTNAPTEIKPPEKNDKKKEQLRELQKMRIAQAQLAGRDVLASPSTVLIEHATIWTCGPQGILTNAQLLVSNGRIQAVGSFKGQLPQGALVIDAQGQHVTPGIIDCHSHSAILGNVNESTLPSTAMVRIRDVVNSETENLYEQLAGGVTTINLLHGSANPIGGQNCVIKLRDGAGPDDLVFRSAPEGIKFALGENVKQSNWGERYTTRFPQTRMGVRTFIQNRFIAAQQYSKEWETYLKAALAASFRTNGAVETGPNGPPRRDLELEAISEILQGKRWIHCHSYRQDEILMLLRLMQGFGVQIGTFQHVLEGYKVADEIAAGKVGASTFSDWWGYKFEVYDAIPYNGTLMRDRGVVVSFNSDSSELARRLYLEAAKAVKYGGASEIEALDFVTLNPAKQLRIDQYVGSLEPGKDADFAIWSRSPLAFDTVCRQTWVDGKKYFDRELDATRTARLKKEREDLIAKAKQMAKVTGGGDNNDKESSNNSFFRVSLEHQFDGVDRHCLDELTKGGE